MNFVWIRLDIRIHVNIPRIMHLIQKETQIPQREILKSSFSVQRDIVVSHSFRRTIKFEELSVHRFPIREEPHKSPRTSQCRTWHILSPKGMNELLLTP